MKKLTFVVCILIIPGLLLYSQVNLIEDWDGNGDTNVATSYPNNYGWDVTVGTFNYANSSSGVRWYDVTSGHTLDGSNYVGRLLMVRWDGAGSTSLASVYSYPVTLEDNKKYLFKWIHEWWNNASAPILTVGIGTDKTGGNLIASHDFTCSSTRQLLQEGEMTFYAVTGGLYYLTIRANNLAALCGIGELSITEMEPVLESTVSSIFLNYYEAEKSFSIYPNGSENTIYISAPEGIGLSDSTLPFSGGEVTVFSADSSNISGNIMITQGTDEISIPVTTSFPGGFINPVRADTLTPDGAWCWFNDPRAIYYKGSKEQTYFSWVNSMGDIMIAAYNHETGVYTKHTLYEKLEVDDHDNPAIFIRRDGRLIVYFSKHTSAPAHRYISTHPEDITFWGDDYRFGENVTYPYPFQVDDDIYVFYRGIDWHPTLIISNDQGETMGPPMLFIAGGGARPYTRFCQDKTGAIHMAFTTAHPRDDPNNKIYYARFKDGKFHRADGTYIKDFTGSATALNIDNHEAETVYAADNGKGWIWDITTDENNHPVMVFASFPTDTDHRYHYARWTGTEWTRKELTNAGRWFPQTVPGRNESEPNYSGGIILDYDDPSVVYLSKQVKGVFEILRFTTPDKGMTWDSTALTWDTPTDLVNARPIVPRHHKKGVFDLVWMRGKYVHYTNYHTSLVFWSDTIIDEVTDIFFNEETVNLTKGLSKHLSVSFVPFITSNKNLTWSSSDDNIVQVNNGVITGINTGTATITATAFNGITATCLVHVTPPDYIYNALFDFGTPASPVDAGAIQVTGTTPFEDSFGWTSSVLERDRGSTETDELRDFNMSSSVAYFKVYVKPGKYHITTKQGDRDWPHDIMNIYVNDELKSTVSTSAGSYSAREYDVETDGEIMAFRFEDGGGSDFNWVINSLKLELRGLYSEENAVPSLTAEVEESDETVINLYAGGLTSDIHLSVSGPDASQFAVDPGTITRPASGTLPSTPVIVSYNPVGAGNHTALLTISSSGLDDLSMELNGSAIYTGINPFSKKIIIYSESGNLRVIGADQYRVYNIQGILVAEKKANADCSSVNLNPGIYLVKIEDDFQKVIVL